MNLINKVFVASLLLVIGSASYAVTPIKSPNDDRDYLSYSLGNKLKVLLVSDPSATKAAASLDVSVGSGADPVKRQGLAHFLEHMLFLGTEKYPDSGDYQDFISSHGGGHNAYTSFENTNYFFDIDASQLEPALDRFAQFFVAPLFNEEYVEREINAVESEYRAKLKEDSRRSLDVFKVVINPQHPFSKLAVGNLQTLRDGLTKPLANEEPAVDKDPSALELDADVVASFESLRADLLEFHDQHYVARNMVLVVLGAEPLPVLKAMVEQRFSAIRKSATASAAPHSSKSTVPPLFSEGSLPKLVSIEPEKQTRNLSISFPIPPIRPLYRYKPSQYIGNIIGHEGEGSLLSMLKNKGWAESLSAGAGLEYDGGATFNISITLTAEGLKNRDTVVAAVHSMIDMIREKGLQRWRYNEQRDILNTAFRFQEKGRAIGYVSSLASGLQHYPAKEALKGPYLMQRFKAGQVKKILASMKPENALITVMAKDLGFDSVSPWYGTRYKIDSVASDTLKLWQQAPEFAELHLPSVNPFIAERFDLLESEPGTEEAGAEVARSAENTPVQLDDTSDTELWWAADPTFQVPRAQQYFNIKSTAAGGSARETALTQLYANAIADGLNELSYPALLAGIQFSVRAHTRGLSIRVGGYNDKQHLLLEKIALALKLDTLTPERLANLHTELLRRWSNAKKRLPYQQLFGSLNEELVHGVWGADKLAAALQTVSLSDLREHSEKISNSASLQALALGNLSPAQARSNAGILNKAISCDSDATCESNKTKVRRLDGEQWSGLDIAVAHNDSAVLKYVQGEDQSDATRAIMAMTAQVLRTDYFQQLRTDQQLGYVVFASTASLLDVPGLAFIVQSPTHSVGHILQATDKFLVQKRALLDSEEFKQEFEQHRSAVLSELREKAKNLSELGERYWADLTIAYPTFARRTSLIEAVANLGYNDWRDFFAEEFNRGVVIWSQGGRDIGDLAASIQQISSGELKSEGAVFTVGAIAK